MGAELLRVHGPKAVRGATLQGHQVMLADILDVPHDVLALLEPRRSFKTSTLFSLAMGRIAARPDFAIAYTMTTLAIKARQRFRDDIVKPLEFLYPDPKERPFKIVKAGGSERIEWIDTQSFFAFVAPKGDAFRSDAWDWIILDEAGEAGVEQGQDIMDGAASTQDTRPDSNITITGTAPRYRTGNLLWDALEKGRAGQVGYAIVDYSIDQSTELDDVDTWEKVEPLIIDIHPAIGHPTPLTAIRKSFELIKAPSFMREYLGVAGTIGENPAFLDVAKWATCGSDEAMPEPPTRFRMAVSCNLLGTAASVVAAWRVDGVANVALLDNRAGAKWTAEFLRKKALKYNTPVVYDKDLAAIQAQIDLMNRAQGRKIPLEPQGWGDVSTAHAGLFDEIKSGNVKHWNQQPLTLAVQRATKRKSLNTKRWAFAPMDYDIDDITPLEAAAMALRAYDASKPKSTVLKPNF